MSSEFSIFPRAGVLPVKVLEQAQQAVLELPGVGISILESAIAPSRSKRDDRSQVMLTELLGIPAGYSILFLQGGSSLQFRWWR